MTRLHYGYSGGDIIAAVSVDDGDFEPSTATFDVFTTRTGATQHTDLLDSAGGAITQVVPTAEGRIAFQGQDGYTGSYWLQDTAAPTAMRYRVDPVDVADRTAPTGFYTKPGGGIPESDLDAAVAAKIDAAVPATLVNAKGDLIVATANDTVARLPIGTTGQRVEVDLTTSTGLKYVTPTASTDYYTKAEVDAMLATRDAAIAALQTSVAAAALKSGGLTQFADVSDTAATLDGQALVFSEATNQLEPTVLSSRFAPVDPSTGRLRESAYPKYMVEGVVLNTGDATPADLPQHALRWDRATAAPTLGITQIATASNGSSSVNNLAPATTVDAEVGDELMAFIETSGAATAPVAFTVVPAVGALGAGTLVGPQVQTGTVLTAIYRAPVTTRIPAGTAITTTARDASNAPVNRAAFSVKIAKGTGLAASSRFDQSGTNGAGATANFTVSSGGATAVASELAVAAFGFNPTGLTFAPGSGWLQLGTIAQNTDPTTPRGLVVVYKILTSTGTTTATGTVTGGTVLYSASLATFRAA